MCPQTGIAYDNPEPNSFSFNSPKGACKSCNGLGFKLEVDVNKIIPNPKISIKNGAISPINGEGSVDNSSNRTNWENMILHSIHLLKIFVKKG